MRTFEKANKLDHVLYDVRGPVVDEAAHMEEMGKKILKLNFAECVRLNQLRSCNT